MRSGVAGGTTTMHAMTIKAFGGLDVLTGRTCRFASRGPAMCW